MSSITRRTALAAGASLLAPAWAQTATPTPDKPLVIKFSHVVAPETPKGKGALRFKELMEIRSGGRVKVEVYPNSTLFKDKDEIAALKRGEVQLLAPSLSKLRPLGVKEFEVFDLPFLFKNRNAFSDTARSYGRTLFTQLEPTGVRGLAFWDNGFLLMSANRRLRDVDDFKGLKMRIQSSAVAEAEMRALGAEPRVMNFSELFTGLQAGSVDGTEGTASNFLTQRLPEVQKHLTLSNHGYLAYALLVNRAFHDGLPADLRAVFDSAIADATQYANAIANTENAWALGKIKTSARVALYAPLAAELDEWRRALMGVHQDVATRVGPAALQAAYQAAGFVPPR